MSGGSGIRIALASLVTLAGVLATSDAEAGRRRGRCWRQARQCRVYAAPSCEMCGPVYRDCCAGAVQAPAVDRGDSGAKEAAPPPPVPQQSPAPKTAARPERPADAGAPPPPSPSDADQPAQPADEPAAAEPPPPRSQPEAGRAAEEP